MARRRMDADQSMELLIETATTLLKDRGASKVTVASVAEAAGSAKGLVHYHFKTKLKLWESVATHLADSRIAAWNSAFTAPSASEAVSRTWTLLTQESVDGTTCAWLSLLGPESPLPDHVASKINIRFHTTIEQALARLLGDLGVEMRVPNAEVGALLASVIAGMGLMLLEGGSGPHLEDAYAAAWLGILSLAR